MAPRFHTLRIESVVRETADAAELRFAVPVDLRDEFRFSPGQYLTLRATIDGADLRRSYSICSGPDDPLAVAVKRIEGGVFSNWINDFVRPEDRMTVMTPDGRFGLPPTSGPARTVAAFVAGSGITPVLAILRALLTREPASRFFLFYGNRTTDSIMFRGALEDLKDRYLARLSVFHVLSREQQDIPVLNGRLDGEKLRVLLGTLLPFHLIDQALVCGPQAMIEGLPFILAERGIPPARIHVERFTPAAGSRPPPPVIRPQLPAAALATVVSEGIRTEFRVLDGETIIDAALRAGRSLPFSCKGGMCCTCRARLLEGEVEMTANYSLEQWETEAGYILTCQARPRTPRVVVDFDQV